MYREKPSHTIIGIIMKECFGNMNSKFCDTDWEYDECVACDDFDKCYKVTTLDSQRNIEVNLALIVRNGEHNGWIKSFSEIEDEEEEECVCPDCTIVN